MILARVEFETGHYEKAIAAGKRAQAVKATRLHGLVWEARALFATGKLDAALKRLEPQAKSTDPGGHALRAELGRLLIAAGRRTDADTPLHDLVDAYNQDIISERDPEGLMWVGRAAELLRSAKDANDAYTEAEKAYGKGVPTDLLLLRAELFFDHYDPGHAEEAALQAKKQSPGRADPKVLLARIKLAESYDFDAATRLANEALAINPRHTGAHAVKAAIHLHDMAFDKAEAEIKSGLAVNPVDEELWSLRAASRFLADRLDEYRSIKSQVLKEHPGSTRFFHVMGELAEWEHRYDDITQMMKEAVQIDAEDSKAWAALGLTQLRGGDETAGMQSLREAWSRDHFNVRVYNTLNLYEDTIAKEYTMSDHGVVRVRFPKDVGPVYERYVPALLAEAWGSMKARYAFVPKNPVQVELFATREHFSVRTSGLPQIAIQGVCFGRVVASIAPSAEPFNWGNVLWHELGHVFAIQMSKNHVPRWFTEGLSEYETIARRPEWQRHLDPQLYTALAGDRLPRARDMNQAFTHAKDAAGMTVAYYAASQMLVFTVERFGMARVLVALQDWGAGKPSDQVISHAFGLSSDAYSEEYRKWQRARLARYDAQFVFDDWAPALSEAKKVYSKKRGDARAHTDLVLALAKASERKAARVELERALGAHPKDGRTRYLGVLFAGPDIKKGLGHLRAMRDAGHDGYAVRMKMAEIANELHDKRALREHLEAAHHFDPSQPEPLRDLVVLAKKERREGDELALITKLSMLEPHDAGIWRRRIELLVEKRAFAEAVRVGESAVYIDVLDAKMHEAYAKALEGSGQAARARFERETAQLLKKTPAQKAPLAHRAPPADPPAGAPTLLRVPAYKSME